MNNNKCEACGRSASLFSLFNNILLAFVKAFVAILSGSKALLADAMHSGADVLCALVGTLSAKVSNNPSDKDHPYGHGKIEFVAGMFIALVLVSISVIIISSAVKSLFFSGYIKAPNLIAAWVALLSICSNFVVSNYTMCAAKELNSPALKAISYDNRSDAYSSIPVLIAIVGAQFGLPQLDAIGGIFVGIVVLKIALELVFENYKGITDFSAPASIIAELKEIILSVPDVKSIGYLNTRKTGRGIWVDVEISVLNSKTVAEANVLSKEVRATIMRRVHNIQTVQVFVKSI